jgi:hypothetical protein
MTPPDPSTVRPRLTDRVHAALVKAGRPVTRGELRMFLGGGYSTDDLQAALDTLVADGLAARGEAPGYRPWQTSVVWRAVKEKG